MMKHIYKYPRLYLNEKFEENANICLLLEHVHYLKNVLRKGGGDILRVFNGVDGEWLARIDALNKKGGEAVLTEKIKDQPSACASINLFFSPIKKQRMDFMVEKAVELGVSGLYPVIMNRTENRKFNVDRMRLQIIEAAEQCERLDLPVLYEPQKFGEVLSISDRGVPLSICLERNLGAKPMASYSYEGGGDFMIGPEGGFDAQEIEQVLSADNVVLVDLGGNILRAETAAISCLSYAGLSIAL